MEVYETPKTFAKYCICKETYNEQIMQENFILGANEMIEKYLFELLCDVMFVWSTTCSTFVAKL